MMKPPFTGPDQEMYQRIVESLRAGGHLRPSDPDPSMEDVGRRWDRATKGAVKEEIADYAATLGKSLMSMTEEDVRDMPRPDRDAVFARAWRLFLADFRSPD